MTGDATTRIDPRLIREAAPPCEQTGCTRLASHAAIIVAVHDPQQRPVAYLVCPQHAMTARGHHDTCPDCPDCPEKYTLRFEALQ